MHQTPTWAIAMSRRKNGHARKRDQFTAEDRVLFAKIRSVLPELGCDLPFYDCIDNYETEFKKLIDGAYRQFPLILAIRELSTQAYRDAHWPSLGYGDLTQINFSGSERSA